MSYNPEITRNRYDNYGDSEWTRLERDAQGELLYHVHLDILKRYIKPSDSVFEIGAGSGRYTKDIVNMCKELTVADISSHQIEFNKEKMKELLLYNRVKDFLVLDVVNMPTMKSESFDCIYSILHKFSCHVKIAKQNSSILKKFILKDVKKSLKTKKLSLNGVTRNKKCTFKIIVKYLLILVWSQDKLNPYRYRYDYSKRYLNQ